MFVDSSVIVAILNEEPGADELERRIEAFHGEIYYSPLVRFEAAIALSRAIAIRQRATRTSEMI